MAHLWLGSLLILRRIRHDACLSRQQISWSNTFVERISLYIKGYTHISMDFLVQHVCLKGLDSFLVLLHFPDEAAVRFACTRVWRVWTHGRQAAAQESDKDRRRNTWAVALYCMISCHCIVDCVITVGCRESLATVQLILCYTIV